jgi:hypothetical protein
MNSGKPRLSTGALTKKIADQGDLDAVQDNASNRHTARAISDDEFRGWLNERLDQPHLYDLEAELLQAAWSA